MFKYILVFFFISVLSPIWALSSEECEWSKHLTNGLDAEKRENVCSDPIVSKVLDCFQGRSSASDESSIDKRGTR